MSDLTPCTRCNGSGVEPATVKHEIVINIGPHDAGLNALFMDWLKGMIRDAGGDPRKLLKPPDEEPPDEPPIPR